jgi:hypothetical protein
MATRIDKIKTIFEAEDNLTPTQKKAADGFVKTGKEADTFGGKIKTASSAMGGMVVAIGGVVAALGVGMFAKSSIEAAIAAEEIDSKYAVVFESVSKRSEKVAKDLAKNYGLAGSEAKKLLSNTGDLLTGFGFTDGAALNLSKKVQELSVDIASFSNIQGGAEQASDIITKALLGERDALTTLGVKVQEADLQNRLAAEGKDKLTGSALLAAKAEATFALITEQSGKAIGDFARTSDSTANKQRILASRFEGVKVAIGNGLMPVWDLLLDGAELLFDKVEPLIPVIGELVTGGFQLAEDSIKATEEAIKSVIGWFDQNKSEAEALAVIIGSVAAAFLLVNGAILAYNVVMGIAAAVTSGFAAAWALITSPIFLAVAAIAALIAIGYLLVKNWESIKTSFEGIVNGIVKFFVDGFEWARKGIENAFASVGRFVEKTINDIRDSVTGFFKGVADVGSNIANAFKQLVNGLVDNLNNALKFDVNILGANVHIDLPDIPRLQTGTNFFPGGLTQINEVGPEMAILPRGTRVQSYDGSDEQIVGEGGGTTINNYNTFYEKVDMNRVATRLAFNLSN